MKNLVQSAKEEIAALAMNAYRSCTADGTLPVLKLIHEVEKKA